MLCSSVRTNHTEQMDGLIKTASVFFIINNIQFEVGDIRQNPMPINILTTWNTMHINTIIIVYIHESCDI